MKTLQTTLRPLFLALTFTLMTTVSANPERPADDWVFIDNGHLRLGIIKSSGAGIGYLSFSQSRSNLLDHYDRGRLIQQSYYGQRDGSKWGKRPWSWNPVQGGDYRGKGSSVTALEVKPTSLYARTIPTHWATGESLTNVVMEEWIALTGSVVHVRFKMAYTGTVSHPACHQEIPAVFLSPELDTLALYDGKAPWTGAPLSRSQPGFPNEGRAITEHWAAYVDARDHGLGIYVPVADKITCYRYRAKGTALSACSYLAPVTTFAMTPGLRFAYDLYLIPGSLGEIRERIMRLHERQTSHTSGP